MHKDGYKDDAIFNASYAGKGILLFNAIFQNVLLITVNYAINYALCNEWNHSIVRSALL